MSSIAAATALNQESISKGKRRSAKDERINIALRAALYSHEDATRG